MFFYFVLCCADPPRKRLDSSVSNSQILLDRVRSHSIGSPFSNSVSELPQVATSPRTGCVCACACACVCVCVYISNNVHVTYFCRLSK